MWNPFRRKKKQTYYEAACAMVGVDPTLVTDFLDAYVIRQDVAVVVIKTATRPLGYLANNPLFMSKVDFGDYWCTFLVPHPSDQAEALDIKDRYESAK